MSRYNPHRDTAPVLAGATEWAKRCLLADGSLFTEHESLWTPEHLDELDRLFVQNPPESEGSFFDKLEDQLQQASPAGHCLMAEAIWVLLLFQSNISAETKRSNVRTVWSGSGSELDPGHPMLSDEVLVGIGNPGTSYNTRRWRELSFLITLTRMFKQLDTEQCRNLLSDGWLLAAWLRDVPEADKRQFRHVLLHLLFPDTFERISSSNDKRRIVAAFSQAREREVDGWDNERIDREILRFREQLERERGKEIDFYTNGVKEQWKPSAPAWLLSWNPKYWPWTSLAEDRASTAHGQPVIHDWRCSSSKPKEGDHAYLVRVGEAPKGVVAYGTVVKAPYDAPDDDQAGKMARFIDVEFSAIRDATRDPIVPLDDLQARQPEQTWNPQGSGILPR
jgi:5-methylcytosine-specific restriction protein B